MPEGKDGVSPRQLLASAPSSATTTFTQTTVSKPTPLAYETGTTMMRTINTGYGKRLLHFSTLSRSKVVLSSRSDLQVDLLSGFETYE